jgi:hypothetical protein
MICDAEKTQRVVVQFLCPEGVPSGFPTAPVLHSYEHCTAKESAASSVDLTWTQGFLSWPWPWQR